MGKATLHVACRKTQLHKTCCGVESKPLGSKCSTRLALEEGAVNPEHGCSTMCRICFECCGGRLTVSGMRKGK